jgi:integrase/recombinase XerD
LAESWFQNEFSSTLNLKPCGTSGWQDGRPRRPYEKNVTRQNEDPQLVGAIDQIPGIRRITPLAMLLEKYLQDLAVKGFSESTLRVRRVHMELFLTWCGKNGTTALAPVTGTFLESYQRHLFDYRKKDGRPLAVASQHSRLAHLKAWFKWLHRRNYIPNDPASELELPRMSYKLPSVFNQEEAELVLRQPRVQKSTGLRDRAILEMLYSTGMRRVELLHLRLYDVDKKHGLVNIREGKGKRDRIVPVGERALFWLERYLAEARPKFARYPDSSVVFLSTAGEALSPNHLSWLARRYVRAAQIGKSGACHIFRHTMATLMLEGGADIRYIQAMLGHVRLDTTKIYTHVSIRMLKQIHTATHPAAQLGLQMSQAGRFQVQLQQLSRDGDRVRDGEKSQIDSQ